MPQRLFFTLAIASFSSLAFATPLHPREHYKFGNELLEKAEFLTHAQKVLAVQKKIQRETKSPVPTRVFHRKSHGCLTGKLTVRDSRDKSLRAGIFADSAKKTYDVVLRFSNGVPLDQHDLKPDVRGVAIKIFGTEDKAFPDRHTMDILMTNAPNPFGRDQQEFVEFMEATTNPGFLQKNMLLFAAEHPEVTKALVHRTLRITKSLTRETFWSGHPYLMGEGHAVKFNLTPVLTADDAKTWGERKSFLDRQLESLLEQAERATSKLADIQEWLKRQASPVTSKLSKDYLKEDLYRRANVSEIKFLLSAQRERDERTTPIENGLQEWLESDTPSLPIADIVLDVQDPSLLYQSCEKLGFNPGHFHSEHRPLSNIGRGRIFAYDASQRGRGAKADPKSVDDLLGLAAE